MLKEFRDFVARGNIVELAIAVVIGTAFGAVVTGFVTSFITPLIAAIGGKSGFAGLRFSLGDAEFVYGIFLNALLSFLIIAAVIFFLIVRPLNALMEHKRTRGAGGRGHARVPRVPVADPVRGAPLRVLHGGGRHCLSSASRRTRRRRTRSRCRATCARRRGARAPWRAISS